jgi:hypothetical protein
MSRGRKTVLHWEEEDKFGHWVRVFPVRSEPWFTLENWARENRFRLVSVKKSHRIYVKGDPDGFLTLVDIKFLDGKTKISSWIEVGKKLRLKTLFMIREEIGIEPSGFISQFHQRRTCRELNTLLALFKQPEIIGTKTFHLGDWDPTTVALLFILPVAPFLYLALSLWGVKLQQELIQPYYLTLRIPFFSITAAIFAVVLIHEWVVARYVKASLAKMSVTFLWFFSFTVAVLLSWGNTSLKLSETKIAYTCFSKGANSPACQKEIALLPEKGRVSVRKKLQNLHEELVNSDL